MYGLDVLLSSLLLCLAHFDRRYTPHHDITDVNYIDVDFKTIGATVGATRYAYK